MTILVQTLEEQVQTLTKLGFVFRDQNNVSAKLEIYDWWKFLDPPFVLLMSCIVNATGSSRKNCICENVIFPDMKHLRHEGWFEHVARELADVSGQGSQLTIEDISKNEAADRWEMEYKIGGQRFELATAFPHKYASYRYSLELLPSFATETNCFFAYQNEDATYNEALICWLPRSSDEGLREIFGDDIRMFDEE